MVMPRLAAIILNRSQIRLFDNDRGLAVGPEGRKLFERFLRQAISYAVRASTGNAARR